MQIRFLTLLFSGFFLAFLILLLLYNLLQSRALEKALDLSDKERLKLLGESIQAAISGHLEESEQDVFFLYSLAEEKKINQILLIDSEGMILADSEREVKNKERVPSDLMGSPWATALGGETVTELSREEESGNRVGTVWIPLQDRGGGRKGVIRMVVPVAIRSDPNAHSFFLFLKFLGSVGGGIFCYYLYRFFFIHPPSYYHEEAEEKVTETGFVMDTFQSLIQQLKQKEQELERLKGMAEEHAKSIESYNENILQSVTSGVLTFNHEKKITTFNAAAGAILHFSPKTVMGKLYDVVFGKNKKIALLLEEALTQEKEGIRQECEVERSDGEKIWLGMNTSVLRDRNNEIIGATLVFTDLTEMKALQDQVELKKRLTVMGEMSAWIAHEFRNYMGTILGFSRLLSKKIDPNNPAQEMIKAITGELSAMDRLITELLSYGKKTMIHPEPIPLGPFLQDLMKQFIDTGAYPHIRWSSSFSDGLPLIELDLVIELDPVLIRQAFSNLIQNALEAMQEEGEISLSIANRPEGMVQVKISDKGPGILKENLDQIFLPFFTTKEKGTGLGLALVHKIILAHNGHISVNSSEGKGTTFTIVLPLSARPFEVKESSWKPF